MMVISYDRKGPVSEAGADYIWLIIWRMKMAFSVLSNLGTGVETGKCDYDRLSRQGDGSTLNGIV